MGVPELIWHCDLDLKIDQDHSYDLNILSDLDHGQVILIFK